MKAIYHVRTALERLWKRKMVKVGVVLFLVFEFVVFVRFDKLTRLFNERNKTAVAQENSTGLQMTIKESPKALNMSGFLNLHLWSDTCAKNLDILCNFPMFPRAPAQRLVLKKTVITGLKNGESKGQRRKTEKTLCRWVKERYRR